MLIAGKPWRDLAPSWAKLPQQETEPERQEEWGAHGGCDTQYRGHRWGPLNWLGKDFGARSIGGTVGEGVYCSGF